MSRRNPEEVYQPSDDENRPFLKRAAEVTMSTLFSGSSKFAVLLDSAFKFAFGIGVPAMSAAKISSSDKEMQEGMSAEMMAYHFFLGVAYIYMTGKGLYRHFTESAKDHPEVFSEMVKLGEKVTTLFPHLRVQESDTAITIAPEEGATEEEQDISRVPLSSREEDQNELFSSAVRSSSLEIPATSDEELHEPITVEDFLKDVNAVFVRQGIDVKLEAKDLVAAIDFKYNSEQPSFVKQTVGKSRKVASAIGGVAAGFALAASIPGALASGDFRLGSLVASASLNGVTALLEGVAAHSGFSSSQKVMGVLRNINHSLDTAIAENVVNPLSVNANSDGNRGTTSAVPARSTILREGVRPVQQQSLEMHSAFPSK